MAERVGFEPTCRLRDKTLSRRPRYDHFGTSPLWVGCTGRPELLIIPAHELRPAVAAATLQPAAGALTPSTPEPQNP